MRTRARDIVSSVGQQARAALTVAQEVRELGARVGALSRVHAEQSEAFSRVSAFLTSPGTGADSAPTGRTPGQA
jgi:hypothetical protein